MKKLSERIADARPGQVNTKLLRQWVTEASALENKLKDTQNRLKAHREGRVMRAIQVPLLSSEELKEMAQQQT